MPSLLDIGQAVAPPLVSGLLNRRANGNATNTLANGVTGAQNTIRQSGTDLQALYQQILANQQSQLQPYQAAGVTNLGRLNAGLAPGGGLADGYNPTTGPAAPGTFNWQPTDLGSDPGFQFRLQQGLKAINAGANANGTRFSGGTLKAVNDYAGASASQEAQAAFDRGHTTYTTNANEYQAGFDRNRATTGDQYNRLMGVTQLGQNAANQNVAAQSDFANRSGNNAQFTAAELANLETERASAIAAGDLGKAKSITDAIAQGVNAVGQIGPAKDLSNYIKGLTGLGSKQLPIATQAAKVAGLATPAAPAAAGLSTIGAGASSATAGTLAGTGALAAPEIAAPALAGAAVPLAGATTVSGGVSSVAGGAAAATTSAAAPLTGYAGGGLVTSHGALIGMATNPITIGVAAAIIGVTALLKSQAHWEANDWVQHFQNKFDSGMNQLNQQFQSAAQSGQLSKDEATQIRNEAAAAIQAYEAKRQDFATKGSDKKTVAGQALQTFNQYYGVNGTDYLGKMDALIAGLA